MTRRKALNLRQFQVVIPLMGLGSAAGVLLSLNGCSGVGNHSVSPPPTQHIQHVVVIFQENRSPDNLFQDPVLYQQRGADIAQSGLNSLGQSVTLTGTTLVNVYDLNHSHTAFEQMYDGGKMDGADKIHVSCPKKDPDCAPANPQYMFVNPADVQPYFQLAEQYTFGDRMFQTNQGPSFPAHQFIISGTSAPTATSDLFASENMNAGAINAGCIAAPGTFTRLIDPSGDESQTIYPCFEHPTLTDLLHAKGISWRYYAPSAGSIWTGPDAIQHMCVPQTQNGQLACTGGPWQNVMIPETQVLTDIAKHQLAQVTWVIPNGATSDHAGATDGSGPSWVASIVNAIGNSSYWGNTAIFITWDDWGGWFDHVAPKVINSYEYGFRVPLIVVSPYAKAAHISHVTHDFGSILKFIEETYGLPSLGYADAPADDFVDCFDFNQTPLTFQTINAPLGAEHFLNDTRPPSDPDDD
ncbi:MAG TPA: alkaline phosphatase family protein [Candidatus Acidoferrales bacterium]|nr:alkaline phosphatase family protein [Candidatus Acidoferrales bacterium]